MRRGSERSGRGRRNFADAIGAMATLTSVGLSPLFGYLGLLTGAAVWARTRNAETTSAERPTRRVVVLVPAHDEERLIADTARSLRATEYPDDLVEVVVIADHCSDATAPAAQAAGATVLVHDDPEPAGKGPALRWAFEQLDRRGAAGDIVVIVDADSVVNAHFFDELASRFDSGARVVQAYYTVRNVDSSVGTGWRTAALALRHHLRPLGRTTLGGSCGLFGNGMAFATDVLRDRAWTDHLTEDLELQVELVLDGIVVDFAPGAIVEAEMPETMDQSRSQNERWERGRIELARRSVPRLLRAARRCEGRRRTALIDTAADVTVPPLSVLAAAVTACSAGGALGFVVRRSAWTTAGLACSAGMSAILLAHVVAGLRIAEAPRSAYRSLLGAPRAIAWKAVLWGRMLVGGDDVRWIRTTRNVELR